VVFSYIGASSGDGVGLKNMWNGRVSVRCSIVGAHWFSVLKGQDYISSQLNGNVLIKKSHHKIPVLFEGWTSQALTEIWALHRTL
jgi:hypothetical protein